jgi:hypothetical protein
MENIEIKNLSEAKKEYTTQMINILKPEIFKGIKELFDQVVENNDENKLLDFQNNLKQITKWNQDIIDQKYETFMKNSSCDWLDDLLQAVFISNTAILTTVKNKNNSKKIDLTIPKSSRFLHKCYIESAREFYKNPYLLLNTLDYKIQQKNMRDSLELISISIENSIRNMLPMKDILRQYLTSVNVNTNTGTDYHLSNETITQKLETPQELKIINDLKAKENIVENNNQNKIEEFNQSLKEEKNYIKIDSIQKLNDLNSESEESDSSDNEEEYDEFIKELDDNVVKNEDEIVNNNNTESLKIIGTETELRNYENESLKDENILKITGTETELRNYENETLKDENINNDNPVENIMDPIVLENTLPLENNIPITIEEVPENLKLENNKPEELMFENNKPEELMFENNKPEELIFENNVDLIKNEEPLENNVIEEQFENNVDLIKNEEPLENNVIEELKINELDNLLHTTSFGMATIPPPEIINEQNNLETSDQNNAPIEKIIIDNNINTALIENLTENLNNNPNEFTLNIKDLELNNEDEFNIMEENINLNRANELINSLQGSGEENIANTKIINIKKNKNIQLNTKQNDEGSNEDLSSEADYYNVDLPEDLV